MKHTGRNLTKEVKALYNYKTLVKDIEEDSYCKDGRREGGREGGSEGHREGGT